MNRALGIAAGVVAVAGVLLIAKCDSNRDAKREGALEERLRGLQRERDSLVIQKAARDTVYRADTVRLTRAVTRFETLRDSVMVRLTDTVLVRETIDAGAAALQACQAAKTTCEQRVADRDRLIANERATRANADSLFRVRLSRANPRILPYGEAMVDPLDSRTVFARGGVEARLLGPIRLSTALQHQTQSEHPWRALVGVRVTF